MPYTTISEEKSTLRQAIRTQMKTLTPEARRASDADLFSRLLQLPELKQARTVLLYYGMGAEPNTAQLLPLLLDLGATVALPRCLPDHQMEARVVSSSTVLVRHAYGMLEPGEDCSVLSKEEIDFILVPGLSFDRNGYRLGQGGGYYDRYLPGYCGSTVALCRDCFLSEAIPHAHHDCPVHLVLTETFLFRGLCPKQA